MNELTAQSRPSHRAGCVQAEGGQRLDSLQQQLPVLSPSMSMEAFNCVLLRQSFGLRVKNGLDA